MLISPMKRIIPVFLVLFLIAYPGSAYEIIKVTLSDGEVLTGRLDVPDAKQVDKLVFFIQSSGPHTYLDHRKIGTREFNYFDFFAQEFNKQGIAFFTYNRRGVYTGSKPPYYDSIDSEKYKKYLPSIESDDLARAINQLKKDKRFRKTKFILLGWSEGTIIATLIADQKKAQVDAIVLAGYCNDNMIDIIKWQLSGAPSFKIHCTYFDANDNEIITKSEYESEEERPSKYRVNAFKNTPFETLDVDKDSVLTSNDFMIMFYPRLSQVVSAYEKGDDDWIWNNYFRVRTQWIREHNELEPNKVRMLRLKMPIVILQGDLDANTPVEGVYDVEGRFKEADKKNLTTYIFKNHDHDLNFASWLFTGKPSEGIAKLFAVIGTL